MSATYRRVVLCDGDGGEAEGYRAACPRAEVLALPSTGAAEAMLAGAFVPVDPLREVYRALRSRPPRDLTELSENTGLSLPQAAFSLGVLGEIGLIKWTPRPFSISMLPMMKRGPEESALFRRARQAKEDGYGLHSL